MKAVCPLCASPSRQERESFLPMELGELYDRSLGVIVSAGDEVIGYFVCGNCDLGFFSPATAAGEEFYETMQKFAWYYLDEKPEYSIAKQFISGRGSLLEVGAGTGAFASFVGAQRYVGLEFNELAIKRAQRHGIRLAKCTIEDHARTHKGAYEYVVSFQVLEHVERPGEFLRACVSCLCPGGRLVLAVPSRDGFAGEAVNNALDMPPHHLTRWSEESMDRMGKLLGLRCVSIQHETVADHHLRWARKVYWEKKLRGWFAMESRILDLRLKARVLSRLAHHLSRVFPGGVSGAGGHTMVACFEKPCE